MEEEQLIEQVKKKYGKEKLVSDELKALKKGDSNFRYLAEIIIKTCGDAELAKNLYKIAVKKMSLNFQDTFDVAVSISSTLKDQKWATLFQPATRLSLPRCGTTSSCTRARCGQDVIGENTKYSGQATLGATTFRKASLRNVDFSGADLQGADFSGAITEGACFDGANLTDTIFTNFTKYKNF